MIFVVLFLDWKCPFWVKLAQKIQNFQFKLKFGTKTISNMQNSVVMFTFSVLGLFLQLLPKNPFGIFWLISQQFTRRDSKLVFSYSIKIKYFEMSLLNSVGGVGSMVLWVASVVWVHGLMGGMDSMDP